LAGRPHFWHNGPGTVDWVASPENPRTSDLRFLVTSYDRCNCFQR
jgi:hypothetical protein